MKRETSVAETKLNEDSNYMKQINLGNEKKEDYDSEEKDIYQENTKEKRKISYADEDGESSLYDDYEAKDDAKREVLNDSEDYEEIEDYSPEILEHSKTLTNNMKLKNLNKASAFDSAAKIKDSELKDKISKLNYSSKMEEPINKNTSSDRVESNAEYENRVEEAIQRKIDALKEEIQRDIKAQQQIKDIEDDNARYDELQDQEYEENERPNFKEEPIEKRQIISKRFTREIANDAVKFSNTNEKTKSLKTKKCKKPPAKQPIKMDKLNTLKNKNLNKRFVVDKSFRPTTSKVLCKKKRAPSRQVFLVNNQHEAKKRQSRCYTLPSKRTAVKSNNILFVNPKSNSNFYTDNRKVSLPDSEAKNDEEERSFAAKHSDSLEALTDSFQELSPRLEKEYKEAFGGLQSEPGNALARFKRIKRMLDSPDAEI
ncbi:hypothetical protein PUN28_003829 [Cardiocondyla obscurior]